MRSSGLGCTLHPVTHFLREGWGGGVGHWAHLLSRAHPNHNCWTTIEKKDCNLPKKIFYIQRHKEESTMTSILKRNRKEETSLVVQWLRPCAPNAGGPDSIPSQGTKILHAKKIGGKNKKEGETIMKLTILLRDRRGDRRLRGREIWDRRRDTEWGTWPQVKQPPWHQRLGEMRQDACLEPSEGAQPCWHLDFGLLASTTMENQFPLIKAAQFAVVHSDSPRKPIQGLSKDSPSHALKTSPSI